MPGMAPNMQAPVLVFPPPSTPILLGGWNRYMSVSLRAAVSRDWGLFWLLLAILAVPGTHALHLQELKGLLEGLTALPMPLRGPRRLLEHQLVPWAQRWLCGRAVSVTSDWWFSLGLMGGIGLAQKLLSLQIREQGMYFHGERNYTSPVAVVITVLHMLKAGQQRWKQRKRKQKW